MRKRMKKLLIIATGGTIASAPTEHGLVPVLDAEALLSYVSVDSKDCIIKGIAIMDIDSSNMNPKRIIKIAETIYYHYQDYDGFIITHGTDTMAYSSAALTYMLANLQKPIIFTGSQTPMTSPDTDAISNIGDAISCAMEELPGIYIVFDGKIINGTRARKLKTKSKDAFGSVNFPIIGRVSDGTVSYTEDSRVKDLIDGTMGRGDLALQSTLNKKIIVVKIFPGIQSDIFDYIRSRYKGVIIEGFGTGGIPNVENNIHQKIQELIQAGVAVVVTTQCLEEGIDLQIYAVGKPLMNQRIITAGDMNMEAIVMKLMWALGNLTSLEDIKTYIETPITGDRS